MFDDVFRQLLCMHLESLCLVSDDMVYVCIIYTNNITHLRVNVMDVKHTYKRGYIDSLAYDV
jgi:hypothetical protein